MDTYIIGIICKKYNSCDTELNTEVKLMQFNTLRTKGDQVVCVAKTNVTRQTCTVK
jgi:hypothetical protein